MTITVGTYTFAPWLRRGIGARINEVDTLGSAPGGANERATVPIGVTLNGDAINKSFALIGPGDIIGVNRQMVVRTEPIAWITNFEPNYLVFIEFYDEDFAWRYTPARASGDRLRPWLALFVLEDTDVAGAREFERTDRRRPLPSIKVLKRDALPPHDQHWCWAHVHVNEGHSTTSEFEKFLMSLHDPHTSNADKIICRLMSPRKLKPDTAYRAFLVPAFEAGRMAGLEQDPTAVDAQKAAWGPGAADPEFPVYYEWSFRTGDDADFESLVEALEPRIMDPSVGIRDIDGAAPGFGLNFGTDIGTLPAEKPPATIGLEGALRAPSMVSRPESLTPTKPFFAVLQYILNIPYEWKAAAGAPKDPVIAPPIYGGRHALRDRIDFTLAGWLNVLNRDPRLRVPAGFGTRVIQTYQEDYVARAWAQIRKVLDFNRRIKFIAYTMATAKVLHASVLTKLSPATLLAIVRPVTSKVLGSPVTVHKQMDDSTLTLAATDAAARRLLRPRGPLARRLAATTPNFDQGQLITDINSGRVSAAPPKTPPTGLPTDSGLAAALGSTVPPAIAALLANSWLIAIILLVLILIALFFGLWAIAITLGLALVGLVYVVRRYRGRLDLKEILTNPGAAAEAVSATPARPNFHFVETDAAYRPTIPGGSTVTATTGASVALPAGITATQTDYFTAAGVGGNSLEANNFRKAASSLFSRLAIEAPIVHRRPINLTIAHEKLVAALDPNRAWPPVIASQIDFPISPSWFLAPEHLVPAMSYPDFDDAMYEKLRDISTELFLPNANLIPPDTISLLETNPPFIEAYMVGLNHEFGRELLWREYPTDQRGSYFRQFWSVRGLIVPEGGAAAPSEEQKNIYRDITPIDTWTSASQLGDHRHPKRPVKKSLVLTIRGELLKKYPNTLIYAQKAHIARDKNGKPMPDREPVIQEVTTEQQMKDELKFPIFLAEIAPDIRFFGFDMTKETAYGDDKPTTASSDWGWFFIIQEIPGEPRFGMDVTFSPDDSATTPITWDDLGWDSFEPELHFVNTAQPPKPAFGNQLTDSQRDQWGRHSADMASILFQKPVMIAVHAREMLGKLDG